LPPAARVGCTTRFPLAVKQPPHAFERRFTYILQWLQYTAFCKKNWNNESQNGTYCSNNNKERTSQLHLIFCGPCNDIFAQLHIRSLLIYGRNLLFNNKNRYNDVSNQQGATTFSFINLFKSALHISGDKFTHPQEHFLTIYNFWCNTPTVLSTGATVEMNSISTVASCRCIVPEAVYRV